LAKRNELVKEGLLCIDFLLKYGIILYMSSLTQEEVILMMSSSDEEEVEFETSKVITVRGCTCPGGCVLQRSCLGCIPRSNLVSRKRKQNPGKKVVDTAEEKMWCTTCNQIKSDRGASFSRVDNPHRDGTCCDCLSMDDSLGC